MIRAWKPSAREGYTVRDKPRDLERFELSVDDEKGYVHADRVYVTGVKMTDGGEVGDGGGGRYLDLDANERERIMSCIF